MKPITERQENCIRVMSRKSKTALPEKLGEMTSYAASEHIDALQAKLGEKPTRTAATADNRILLSVAAKLVYQRSQDENPLADVDVFKGRVLELHRTLLELHTEVAR